MDQKIMKYNLFLKKLQETSLHSPPNSIWKKKKTAYKVDTKYTSSFHAKHNQEYSTYTPNQLLLNSTLCGQDMGTYSMPCIPCFP